MSEKLSNIMNQKEKDLFAQYLKDAGIELPSTDDLSEEKKKLDMISPSEERAWLMHQQDPLAASGPFAMAFRLVGNIDKTLLKQSILKLYQGASNLNVTFQYDSEGKLSKCHNNFDQLEVAEYSIESYEEAVNIILNIQRKAFNLSTESVLKFVLLEKEPDDIILGILGHHILLDDTSWKPIFSFLSTYYNGKAIAEIQNIRTPAVCLANDKSNEFWIENYPNGLKKINFPNSFKNFDYQGIDIIEGGKKNYLNQSVPVARFTTSIELTAVEALSHKVNSSIFQTIVALFGSYISGILMKEGIDILIPIVPIHEINSLEQIEARSNVIPVTVCTGGKSVQDIIATTRDRMLMGIQNSSTPIEEIISITKTKRDSIPNILITQFIDSSVYLKLKDITVQGLSIPPIASAYDMTLAVQTTEDNSLILELTTGSGLSKTIGAYLLEQFIQFILTQKAEEVPLLSFISTQPVHIEEINQANSPSQNSPAASEQINSILRIILATLAEELSISEMTEDDDFFDLGGHSLLATRIIGKLLSKHNIQLNINDFFEHPTARGLASCAVYVLPEENKFSSEKVEENNVIQESQNNSEVEIKAPISFLQKCCLIISDYGKNPLFNIPYALKLSQALDEEVLKKAFLDILERHHSLRSVFKIENDIPEQHVIKVDYLSQYKWFWFSKEQDQDYRDILRQETSYSFNLLNELPLRIKLLKDDDGHQILSILVYHSAIDEWSTEIFLKDLKSAYQSRERNQIPVWETTPFQFHEYATLQEGIEIQQEHIDYWLNSIGKIKKTAPLFSTEKQDDEHLLDPTGSWIEFSLSNEIATSLNAFAKRNKVSLFHTIYSSIALSLYILGAGKNIVIGTSLSQREDIRILDTLGFFTTVGLHKINLNEEMTLDQLVLQVKKKIIESLPYSDVPINVIEDTVRHEEETSLDNLFEFYVQLHAKNILNGYFTLLDETRIKHELIEPDRIISKFGLHFEVFEECLSLPNPIRLIISYKVSHYDRTQIELIKTVLENVLSIIAQAENEDVSIMSVRKHLSLETYLNGEKG